MDTPRTKNTVGTTIGVLLFLASWAILCGLARSPTVRGVALLFVFASPIVLAIVSRRWRNYGCAMVAALILLCLLLPVFIVPSRTERGDFCLNNLKQITLAIDTYRQKHGSFPPAYIADEHGRPMHSWRVLILPYLGCQYLYDAYDFNEPWDGPNNRKLADKCPSFCCPSDEAAGSPSQNTSYVAVVGPHAAWTGATGLKQSDFQDGASNTILVVETANSGINWMEPRDLDMAQMAKTINPKTGQGISSKHTEGASAAFADGSIQVLRNNLPSQTLEALLTRDGGEDVDPNQ